MGRNKSELKVLKEILENHIEKTTADLEIAIKLFETKRKPSFELNLLCAYLLKLKEIKNNQNQIRIEEYDYRQKVYLEKDTSKIDVDKL